MKTLSPWCHFILLLITWSICSCSTSITSSPAPKINETESQVPPVQVVLHNKTVLTHEIVELVCEVKPESSALAITWSKGNEPLLPNQRVKVGKNKVMINNTIPNDNGYYTCTVKSARGIQSRTAFLSVTESEDEEESGEDEDESSGDHEEFPCGRAEKKKVTNCDISYGFQNCKSFAPIVDATEIKILQTFNNSIKNKPTITMEVQWKVPLYGNSDIWGWQIIVAQPGVGSQQCYQINRKYTDESKTFVNSHIVPGIPPGITLALSIQSLPAVNMDSLAKKTIQIEKVLCHPYPESSCCCRCSEFPELPCCYKSENVVIKQVDDTSVLFSWPSFGKISTVLSGFRIAYNSSPVYPLNADVCHEGNKDTYITDFRNKSFITLDNLRPRCENYTFKITPIFTNYGCKKTCSVFDCDRSSMMGRRPQFYNFRMTMNESSTLHHGSPQPLNNLFKALVIVVVFFVALVCLAIAIMIRKRKRALEKRNVPDTDSKGRPVTEVFIAHGSHCKACEDAVLAVATYLNMTGHCRCYLDLCSLPKEWSPGTSQYYENQIQTRQKVIILFTVNEDQESEESIKARNFTYQKNLIRSELLANCPTTKFIPVYMDFLSDLDIPCFLRNKKSFSLPSQLTELVLYIIGEPVCKPVSVCPVVSLEEDSGLLKQMKILEAKIKDLDAKHQKKMRNKNNNFLAKIV